MLPEKRWQVYKESVDAMRQRWFEISMTIERGTDLDEAFTQALAFICLEGNLDNSISVSNNINAVGDQVRSNKTALCAHC